MWVNGKPISIRAGRPGYVISALTMSLVPDSVRMLHRLCAVHYLPLESRFGRATPNDNTDRAISRLSDRVARRVSALSGCFDWHAMELEQRAVCCFY